MMFVCILPETKGISFYKIKDIKAQGWQDGIIFLQFNYCQKGYEDQSNQGYNIQAERIFFTAATGRRNRLGKIVLHNV